MTWLKNFLTISLITLLAFIISLQILIFLTPKYFLMEKFFSQYGLFNVANSVIEGASFLKYREGQLFYKGGHLGNYTELAILALPTPKLVWSCKGGFLEAEPSILLDELHIKMKNFDCASSFQKGWSDLILKDKDIKGSLKLQKVKFEQNGMEITVEEIFLRFFGTKTEGYIKYMGSELKGGGRIYWNFKAPLESKISLRFTGNGITLKVEGTLGNPKVYLK